MLHSFPTRRSSDLDPERLAAAWRELAETGRIDLTAEQARFESEFGFQSGTSTHADRVATIKSVFEASGVLIDPHTADGVKVAREHVEAGVPMLVLETAKPAKFPEIVLEATGERIGMPEHLGNLLELPQHVTEMADDEAELRAFVAERAVKR